MKKTIKIGGSFEGVVSTGSFQNARPGFYVEETFETDGELTDEELFLRQKFLQERSYQNFKDAERNAIRERIENERKDFRWYTLPNGKLVPSVTSILNFDKDFEIPLHELSQYASWGTILHAQISEYFKTGKWKEPKDLEGVYADFIIVKKGSLMLDLEGIDFPAFLKKYPISIRSHDLKVYNADHEYAGEIDFWGIPEANKEEWQAIPTMIDAKRTPDKSHFLQTAAYAKAKPFDSKAEWPESFKQMMLLPLRSDSKQGFSKPMVSIEIDRAFELFLAKRKKFRERYGI